MADFDVNADTRPALPYPNTGRAKPSISALKTAISGSGKASSYPTDRLNAATKNDLIYICRTEGISVVGL